MLLKYRTKLYLALNGVALASSFLALGIVYTETKKYFFEEIGSKMMTLASTIAADTDAELLKQIHTRRDENTPAYQSIKEKFRKFLLANRRPDFYVKYIYTLNPSVENAHIYVFGVDAEDPNSKNFSHVGDVDGTEPIIDAHRLESSYYNNFREDEWGVWLTGFAPVVDKDGNYVATVGADISAINVNKRLNMLLLFGLSGMLASLILAEVFAKILSKRVSASIETVCAGVNEIGKGNLDVKVHLDTQDEFQELAQTINQMSTGLLEREKLKRGFVRYVSQHVLDRILKSEKPLQLEGERKKVTLLFSDIREFTLLAEKLPPETVVLLLNEYFEAMLNVIFANQGTLDKFIGDGIMVEFGAPLEDLEQEDHAVKAAIEMQKELQRLSKKWQLEGKPVLHMGIGIHTGLAIVGNIGSEKRMEYTAIGDAVNIASRLERMTRKFETAIIISETTYKGLKRTVSVENLGALELPGHREKIIAYSINMNTLREF